MAFYEAHACAYTCTEIGEGVCLTFEVPRFRQQLSVRLASKSNSGLQKHGPFSYVQIWRGRPIALQITIVSN